MPQSVSLAWMGWLLTLLVLSLGAQVDSPYSSYLFVYFTGEGLADGETVSFAVSNRNDGLNWTEVHGGKPVLTSTVGTKGARDPTVLRSPDGKKFWILATDQKMHGSGLSWDNARRKGSRSIVVWESTNLMHWDSSRLAQISPPTAGNTWAPDAIWDHQRKIYHVFWASSLYSPSDSAHNSSSTYHRVMRSTTKDFRTFTPAEVYIDTGYSVIDTTVVFDESTSMYHRFSKDERPNGSGQGKNEDGKFIFQETSRDILGPWKSVKTGIGKGTISRGEGPLVFKSNTTPHKWYMFIDEFGGRGYVPFETTDIDKAVWTYPKSSALPHKSRHGYVIPMKVIPFQSKSFSCFLESNRLVEPKPRRNIYLPFDERSLHYLQACDVDAV